MEVPVDCEPLGELPAIHFLAEPLDRHSEMRRQAKQENPRRADG
jgi:hypothetical protein